MNRWKSCSLGIVVAVLVILAALWGPEWIAARRDERLLNSITTEAVEGAEGYRYRMSSNQKLYLLGRCLSSQTLPESELRFLTRVDNEAGNYGEMTGTYAFVENRQQPGEGQIQEEAVYEACNREIQTLKEQGILPGEVKEVSEDSYEAVICSAIDVLEPRNNLSVWKISLSTDVRNADKSNRFLDIYLDADTGKMYEFYVRTGQQWEDTDTDAMIDRYAEYLELTGLEKYEDQNPLLETTPYFAKYTFPGEEGSTTVTIGYYEGIRELFLKVGR
jgi:hypothetical protein